MAIRNRGGHQVFGFAAGVAKHNALVASAFFFVAAIGIDALRDMRRLAMHVNLNLRVLPMKAVLLIADVFDGGARDGFHLFFGNQSGRAHFASQND